MPTFSEEAFAIPSFTTSDTYTGAQMIYIITKTGNVVAIPSIILAMTGPSYANATIYINSPFAYSGAYPTDRTVVLKRDANLTLQASTTVVDTYMESGSSIVSGVGTTITIDSTVSINDGALLTGNGSFIFTGQEVNVKWFGAVGDFNFTSSTGTACATALQSSVSSLPNGGTVIIPSGIYLVSATTVIPTGVTVVGDGQVDSNSYSTATLTNDLKGGTLIVIDDATTAFSFDKGALDTAASNSIRDMSFCSRLISQAAYAAPPVFPSNTIAILLDYTAAFVADNLGFFNIERCFTNTSGNLTVKGYFSNLNSKDVGYTFDMTYGAADMTITACTAIKNNYFFRGLRVDGLTLTDSTIYRSYVSAISFPLVTNSPSEFITITGNKFFESGSILAELNLISSLVMTGNTFSRAGLVTTTPQTGLAVNRCENALVTGNFVERPKGDGVHLTNNNSLNFNGSVLVPGWGIGNKTGIVATGNVVANVNAVISCAGGAVVCAANLTDNTSILGTIVSDDILRGDIANIVDNGVTTVSYTTTAGTMNIAGDIAIGTIPYVDLLQYTEIIVYDIVFPIGGAGVGMEGLAFRVADDFTTLLDASGHLVLRKEVIKNETATPISGSVTIYLYNPTGSTYAVADALPITFKYKTVTYATVGWVIA